MRKGGGKSKGSSFERDICRRLSLWVSSGAQEDVFWRSAMSGGRSTVAHAKGKRLAAQAGDISCINPAGYSLTDKFFIEAKFYKDLNFDGLLKGIGNLSNFWEVAQTESQRYNKLPLLIAKQNRHPTMLCTNTLGLHFLKAFDKVKVTLPKSDLSILLLEEVLNSPCVNTRLFHYIHSEAAYAFRQQKHGAVQRQIEFEFEFEDWVSWWEGNLGSDWQSKRGREKAQYVMARLNDSGPYSVENVKCITQSENAKERGINGTAAKGTSIATNKLSEKQIIDIFYDKRTTVEIANSYGIDKTNVYLIKKRQTWKHLLSKLPDEKILRERIKT